MSVLVMEPKKIFLIQVVAETDADAKRVARDVLYDENGFRVRDVFEQKITEDESFWMEEWGR